MQTGILDRTRLMANVLMLVLVGLNIFFSIQYTQNMKRDDENKVNQQIKADTQLRVSKFMKLFIDKVLGTGGSISFEDRVKLESDIRGLGDEAIIKQWDAFVVSEDSQAAQKNAVILMSMLMNKMII